MDCFGTSEGWDLDWMVEGRIEEGNLRMEVVMIVVGFLNPEVEKMVEEEETVLRTEVVMMMGVAVVAGMVEVMVMMMGLVKVVVKGVVIFY